MMDKFAQTYSYKLIYVFSMPYDSHRGLLKVGEATLCTDVKPTSLVPNCHALNQAAKARIDSYTKTASAEPVSGSSATLSFTESTWYGSTTQLEVHAISSGVTLYQITNTAGSSIIYVLIIVP